MFNRHRKDQFSLYTTARTHFIAHPEQLIDIEEFLSTWIFKKVQDDLNNIMRDYNEASYLYPFWQNYPPDDRGRSPRGDQFPWIEVGEHSMGCKLVRYVSEDFEVRDTGLPTGSDQRFILQSAQINTLTNGFTDAVWLFVDIKSVGPRDNFPHAVMSHNQISGDGIWGLEKDGLRNSILKATGTISSHDFHCSVPPVYILSDGTIAPAITIAIKPIYSMLCNIRKGLGQPLSKITFVSIPNGLLLTESPGYLKKYPGLLFPGKDDKMKNPLKVRARVSFPLLKKIAPWRIKDLEVTLPGD